MASFTTSEPPVPRNQPAILSTSPTIPTPSFGGNGSFTISCSTNIAASPETCLGVILKPGDYPRWNPLIPKVTDMVAPVPDTASGGAAKLPPAHLRGPEFIAVGTAMTFAVHLDLDSKTTNRSRELCTIIEPLSLDGGARKGWLVAWKPVDWSQWLMRAERVQELVEDGAGGTEYTCWETYYGPMATVIRLLVGTKVTKGFQGWMVGMKKFAEELKK